MVRPGLHLGFIRHRRIYRGSGLNHKASLDGKIKGLLVQGWGNISFTIEGAKVSWTLGLLYDVDSSDNIHKNLLFPENEIYKTSVSGERGRYVRIFSYFCS